MPSPARTPAGSPTSQRPKGARSAYLIFCREKRDALGEADEQLMGSDLGKMWADLDEKERAKYEELSKADKERFRKETDEYVASGGSLGREFAIALPRVKKIMNLDSQIGQIAKEALVVAAKATESFIGHFAAQAGRFALADKRRIVRERDYYAAIGFYPELEFLQIPNFVRGSPAQQSDDGSESDEDGSEKNSEGGGSPQNAGDVSVEADEEEQKSDAGNNDEEKKTGDNADPTNEINGVEQPNASENVARTATDDASDEKNSVGGSREARGAQDREGDENSEAKDVQDNEGETKMEIEVENDESGAVNGSNDNTNVDE